VQRCHVCGRLADGRGLDVGGHRLCPVCERITVHLAPQHPLYPFWVHLLHGFAGAGGD